MSMTYADCYLSELAEKIFDQLETERKFNGGYFKQEDFNRIEREEMAKKIDELWLELEALKGKLPCKEN